MSAKPERGQRAPDQSVDMVQRKDIQDAAPVVESVDPAKDVELCI